MARRLAAAAVVAIPGAALAQSPPATVSEVIVTGTRLPQASLIAGGPAVSVDRADLDRAGVVTLETFLNTLPQVVPSFGAAANNPSANGAAFVDLRGLGSARNLVLVDGRRLVGANSEGAVDINAIPPGLVDRIEVTTGGASAVYGADAVAGVVNIILRRDLQGVELSGRTTVSEKGDARQHQVDLAAGRVFDRGRVLAAGSWMDRESVGKGARDFTAQAQNISSYFPSGAYVTGPNQPSQAAVDALFAGYGVAPGSVVRGGGFGGFGFNADGTLFASGIPGSPIDAQNYRGPLDGVTSAFYPDVYTFNFEPFNKLILPLERRTAAVTGDLEVTPGVTVYGQALYARYTADTSLAPTPAPTATNPEAAFLAAPLFTIPATHPLIPPDLARLLASRTGDLPPLPGAGAGEDFLYRFRTLALGPRISSNRVETRHLVAGARLRLPRDWDLDLYGAWGVYRLRETQGGLLSVTRTQQLLRSPTAGAEVCAGGFNPFGVEFSDECAAYVTVEATNRTRIAQDNLVAVAAGPLLEAPAGPVVLAVGLEHRAQRFRFAPASPGGPGEIAGFNPALPLSGSLRFNDVFAEASAPLWPGRGGAPVLELVLGGRLSDDSVGNLARSYKAELSWQALPSLRLRGTAQRAVRAPNIAELFAPARDDFAVATDPCSADSPQRTAQVLALCQAQAQAIAFPPDLLAAFRQFDPSVGVVAGGAAGLDPERATTFTLGFVWRPTVGGGRVVRPVLSLDAYEITIRGAIGPADPQVQINACYNLDGGNPAYDPAAPACRALSRSPVDFSLFGLDGRDINQASLATSGVDLTAAAALDLAEAWAAPRLGVLDVRLMVSWLDRFEERASPARPKVDFTGTVAGSGAGYQTLPRWKGRLDLAWRTGDVELALAGRYVGRMSHRILRFDPTVDAVGVGAATYWDASARWSVGRRAELRGGVFNLFDRGPELYRPAVDANTEPSTYDVIGRRFWVGLTVRR